MTYTQNCINQIIFQKNISTATTFFDVDVSSTNSAIILLRDIQFVSPSSGDALLLQTAQSGGPFDTSGYVSGVQYFQYNNNSWSNQNNSTGILLSFYDSANHTMNYYAAYYFFGLNTTQQTLQTGTFTQYSATTTIGGIASGRSAGTNVSNIRFQMTTGATISSGLFTVYAPTI